MRSRVRLGLVRLTDSAPVMVARERDIFQALDLHPVLSIEPSWANLADKLAYGLIDAAVMLPPLALALAMGLRGPPVKLLVPMGLSQGGNMIVLGGMPPAEDVGLPPGPAMLAWLRRQNGRPRIAVEHQFSSHNLLLRYWLALTGVDPDHDIEIVVVPPQQVVSALSCGQITGFCAGAPWGTAAEQEGAGTVLMGTSTIWPFHPEKCVAVREDWADANPEALNRLLRALMRGQVICDRAEEADAVARLLADPEGLGLPAEATRGALAGGNGLEQIHFHGAGAAFPAPPHAIWFLSQMRRWGWIDESIDASAVANTVYRPDLFARAARLEEVFVPMGPDREVALSGAQNRPRGGSLKLSNF